MTSRRLVASVVFFVASLAPAWGRSPGQSVLDEGAALYKLGRYQDALTKFQRAADLDPALTMAWTNIGWAQHRLGNDDEALRVWGTVLKLEPRNAATWNAVGEVHFGRGAWGAAVEAFRNSLASQRNQWDVMLRLGQAYENLDRPDEAAARYADILTRRPGNTKAVERLADLEEARGRLDAAKNVLRSGIARGAESDDALAKRLARVLAKVGDGAFGAGDFQAAADAYREAASHDPERILYLVNLGWAERKAGNNRSAVEAWTGALDRGVASPADLWKAVGDACRDDGRDADARNAYARAAQADPGAGAAIQALASSSLESGDVNGAVRSIRELFVSGTPGAADAIRSADLFIRNGSEEAGVQLFEELANDPAKADVASLALGRLRASQGGAAYRAGDYARASVLYRQALDGDPGNAPALRDYGWALWRLEDWAGVRRVWAAYVAAYPERPEPRALMAKLELQHGDPAAAVEQARQSIALGAEPKPSEMLMTKAYLATGKFHRARELGERLATAYPDDLAVQTLYAETLWRNLDFPLAKDQWRKVLDMGGVTPRAMHYWLRSSYETGAYDKAIGQAEQLVESGTASEPVLRLLAEDALVRGDDAATARWYRALAVRFPQRVAYWTALAEVYRTSEDPRTEERVLNDALVRHPDSPELLLRHAEAERALERPEQALREFRALANRLGRNRSVFEGELDSLDALGRFGEALSLIRGEGGSYLDATDKTLREASILENLGKHDQAALLRGRVIAPPDETVALPILLYHGIAEHQRTINVPLDRFEAEMKAIRDAGFTSITVAEMDAMLSGLVPFPEKPIVLTFDDARGDSLRYADPVLARLGMKATMFVPTARIADESAFNTDWATLVRLAASGRWDFQAHGHLAHDPIPIDEQGSLAEFLVNREWLSDEGRMETHDEFVARVEADYALCADRLRENVPGQHVVGFAFPFSEMGQLHGGNDPTALDVNERAFRKMYRYGFVQDSSGYNVVTVGSTGPFVLHRLSVRREWDGERLLAELAAHAPPQRARLAAAEADVANGSYRDAEAAMRAMTRAEPETYPSAGVVLARSLKEQGRSREAESALADVPTGPAWGRPDASRRKLANDLAWETDPSVGAETRSDSDSDGRSSFAVLANTTFPLRAPVDLRGTIGSAGWRDKERPSLAGAEGSIALDWSASAEATPGGWLRFRKLGSTVSTIEGQATVRANIDAHRIGVACGVTDVETVGALMDGIQKRGCDLAYDVRGRRWQSRARLTLHELTDGNALATTWADGTVNFRSRPEVSLGARIEFGDSRYTREAYYAPSRLATALAIVRYAQSFASGASLDLEAGVGPSRDARFPARLVGQARLAWSQDWRPRWRSTLTAAYGQTPGYRRTEVGFTFGYRF